MLGGYTCDDSSGKRVYCSVRSKWIGYLQDCHCFTSQMFLIFPPPASFQCWLFVLLQRASLHSLSHPLILVFPLVLVLLFSPWFCHTCVKLPIGLWLLVTWFIWNQISALIAHVWSPSCLIFPVWPFVDSRFIAFILRIIPLPLLECFSFFFVQRVKTKIYENNSFIASRNDIKMIK
jgi:hypothetical protein